MAITAVHGTVSSFQIATLSTLDAILHFPLLWLLSEFFIFDFLQFVYDMPTCSEVVLVFLFFFYSVILGVL